MSRPNFPRDDADALDDRLPGTGTVRRAPAFPTPIWQSGPGPTPWSAAEDGPHVALISGVHPAEYPAIESNIRFTRN